jgi:hypothetical protein
MSDNVIKASEVKRIPIKEFRKLGFIQEINRKLLHPCGLALEVIVDKDTGEETLGGVWDSRDDPDGIIFADGVLDAEKRDSVRSTRGEHASLRRERFGWIIQPVSEDVGDGHPSS